MDRTLQLGYAKGSLILVSILFAILAVWRMTVGNLSVDQIQSRKAELFYWNAILISNTLGTAFGDFLSDDTGLGFLGSWILVSALLLMILTAYAFTRINRLMLFWFAFILTRPFGATFGDLLTKSHDQGGLEWSRGYASLALLVMLFGALTLKVNRKD
jgi:uncharacterized membrane-anchored protein